MIKNLGKLLITLMLVFLSISVCLSNDHACEKSSKSAFGTDSSLSSQTQQTQQTQQESQEANCICTLSCHNMFLAKASVSFRPKSATILSISFLFIQVKYPQVLISLDKPPIV